MHSLIKWFARNSVASNLLMILLLLMGGYYALNKIPVEYFPEDAPDEINISMTYRGATPSDVEEGVVVKIENAVRDLAGIRELFSFANEGKGEVNIEVEQGHDAGQLLDEVKARVDAINNFNPDAERPVVTIDQGISSAVTVVVSADMELRDLRKLGEQVRDRITSLPGVTLANLRGVKPYEISVEVSEKDLQRYRLTLNDVATAIRRNSIDVPAGSIKTAAGDILLRTKAQAYVKEEFDAILLRAGEGGARVLLKDVARVTDGFDEEPLYALYNGKPSVFLRVERTRTQNLLKITDTIKDWIKTAPATLPPGTQLSLWRDNSRPVKDRLSYLLQNALYGAVLVFLVLALFLRTAFAFWVVSGIPIAFAGGLIVMHWLGYSINLFSLFGFIVVMGIITDDAIVVGESVYEHARRGKSPEDAAIEGTLDVATPVTFGVLTVVVAFVPLLLMTGRRGTFFQQIPAVVIPVLLASLIESKLILPAHLAHVRWDTKPGLIGRMQNAVAGWLDTFVVARVYMPLLRWAMRHRYATLSAFLAVLLMAAGLLKGGHIPWQPWPRFPGDSISCQLEMNIGTPAEITERHLHHLLSSAGRIKGKYKNAETGQSEILNVLAIMGSQGISRSQVGGRGAAHLCEVVLELPPFEERSIDTEALKTEWRALIGLIPGARELRFIDGYGRGGGSAPFEVQVSGQNIDDMVAASEQLQSHLKTYRGVNDVNDDYSVGKQEIRVDRVLPEAAARGVTSELIARQLRQSFFGEEAQRIQRGRDDVRVMVRYPKRERTSLDALEKIKIRSPDGSEIPLSSAAEWRYVRSPSSIRRYNKARVIRVFADLDSRTVDVLALREAVTAKMNEMQQANPALAFSLEGEAKDDRESFRSLAWGLGFVLFALYALMAIPFKNYFMPLIILLVIPFGWIGAAGGHLVKGLSLSFFSVLGMLTLSGVVVNDSLVLVDSVNKHLQEGLSTEEAATGAARSRFRAIFLTNLTAFAGLVPVIFQSHLTENFLNQMSVSIGFGVICSFIVTLFLVPINYLILADIRGWLSGAPQPLATVPAPPLVLGGGGG